MTTMRDVVEASGFSSATVSRALRHDPLVRPETQKAILDAARAIGYEVNPFVRKVMSSLRRKEDVGLKGTLALIWYTPAHHPDHSFLNQIREGVIKRALEFGYGVDQFNLAEYSPRRLMEILRNRGIRGILVSPPVGVAGKTRLRLDISKFACVSLGWALLHPPMHTIRIDHFHVMQMAIHHARHKFGHGIAAFCNLDSDRRADHSWSASFSAHHPAGKAIASELFFDAKTVRYDSAMPLLQKYRIRGIITELGISVPDWAYTVVPKENLIYLTDPGKTPCAGWIRMRWDLVGAWGVDLLTQCIELHEYGIPELRKTMLVSPQWVEGIHQGTAGAKQTRSAGLTV